MVMLTIYIQLIIFNIHIWLCLPYTYNQYYFNNLIYYNKYIKYAELKSQFRTFKEFQMSGIKIELKGENTEVSRIKIEIKGKYKTCVQK